MAISPAERDGTSHDTEALYREHGAAVAALCRSLLRDRAETEDATQQVFLSAHRGLLNGAAPREPRAWLLAVARNECYARFRERASTPTPTGDTPETATPDASVHALRAGELANVWDEVGRMPATQREAFLLREIRGLSYGQVADELSLSGPSVRSLLLRARMRLRRRLGDVAAGLGGVPWVQALLRLFAGGDAASPVPVATKAAAVGIGALALAGGGGLAAHHAAQTAHHATQHHATEPHRATARVHNVAQAPLVAVASLEHRPRLDNRGADDRGRAGGSRDSGDRGRDRDSHSSGESSSGGGRDGSGDTAVATRNASNGSDGGGSTSSGPGSADGSSSGSGDDGSDGGSGVVTTATSSGSDSGSSDSSGSNGSGGGGGSDDGGGHDSSTH